MKKATVTMYPSRTNIDLLDPNPDHIHIEDIAHHLSMIPRWTGGTRFPYSVAQHSMWCYRHVLGPELGLQALMHDATEAYINDVAAPLKRHLPKYNLVEARLWFEITNKFGMPEIFADEVRKVDGLALVAEQKVLRGTELVIDPIIRYQHWTLTKKQFLDLFHRLTNNQFNPTPASVAAKQLPLMLCQIQ